MFELANNTHPSLAVQGLESISNNIIVNGVLSLNFKVGGQHIAFNTAGVFSSISIVTSDSLM